MKKIFITTSLSFIITFAMCMVLVGTTVINRMSVEKLTMEQIIVEKSMRAQEVLSRLLYKTQTLSTLVLQRDGIMENFEKIAATVIDDPAILNILIAPNGVVSNVFPLKGNESVIGLNFFSEGAGNKEAVMAKESGKLVFGGPFNAVQGGQILVGRLPVFMDEPDGSKTFWGLVSVTLKYPDALNGAGFIELQSQGFAYEIWRINPDDGEKQIIASSGYKYNSHTLYIEKHIPIVNADWYFRILPVKAWYEYTETWILVFFSFCISFLVSFVTQNNIELRLLKINFENLSQTDSLTGIHNRRYFTEYAANEVERTYRLKSNSFVIMLDVDHFKKINDKYGHSVGDEVLKDISKRVKNTIRPYDLFARYGGEEFIILISDIEKESAINLAERIRMNISENAVECKNTSISVTISLGIAAASPFNSLHTAIEDSDRALYMAKESGRNKTVFWELSDTETEQA